MSSTTIPKSFFDAAELVNDLSDPTLDLDQVVFMTDSEDSTGAPDIALQEVVVNEHNKCLAEENPIQITVKQEEEFIIEDDGVGDVKSEDEEEQIEEIRGNFPFPSPYDSECIAHTILIPSELLTDDSEVNQGASTSFSADCEIIRIEPPSGMSPPPTLSQPSEDEQFELIHDEEKAEPDRSLVDHLYSQSETSKKDICNDIIQNMLIDTGHEGSSAAVKLLSKFNEILEHYFVEEENLQLSLFSRSMKKCLEEYKPAEAEQAIELPNPEKLLVFDEVPMTQEKVIEEDESSQLDLSLQNVDLPETELMEDDEATRIIDNLDAELPTFIKETESALKLKADLKNFQEIATKISTDASEMLKISMETEEKTSLAKEKFIELIKNTRQELQTVQTSVTGEEKQPKKKKKSRKIDLFDSDSDLDSYLNQMSKKSKSGPQTPAVVSSTKDDSEVGSDDEEAAPERSGDVSASSSSGEGKSVDKDIQRLLNFETLNNKPAPSKTLKTKIVKKTVKPKVPGDVSENYSSLSDNESDTEDSTTNVDEADSETTDEEEKLQRKVNEQNKLDLLADSDVSKSSGDDSDDFDFLSSDDESSKDQVKSVKTKKTANGLKKPIISESESDDELTEDEGGDADRSKKRKKRVRRDSLEREIFHKDFLDIDGESEKSTVAKKPKIDGEATRKSVEITVSSPSKIDNSPLKENLELFENTKIPKPANLEAVFEKRALAFEHNPPAGSSISSSSTTTSAGPSFSGQKLKPILIEEEGWITLSSDSDSEVSAATSGTNPSTIPNRKKMLSEEELQKETKEAQKAEKQRIERLEKKAQQLSQIMSQRLSQDPDKSETLVLDFDKDKKTIEVHPKLVKFLKKHQVDGVKFMYDTCFGSVSDKEVTASGCILAHCMGLGKTLQLITLIHTLISYPQLKTKRILVICPKSTIMNWKDEFLHWLDGIDTKNLKIDYLGDTMKIQERVNLLKKWHTSSRPGVFLINYEAFRNLVNYSGSHGLKAKIPLPASVVQRLQEDITRCLLSPGPDLVVCDEGHLIKNLASKITKAITKIETRRRIILTGTPVQNNLNEYYAMVDWIKPALLGTVKEFNNLYVNPIKDGQHVDSTPQLIKKMKQRSLILYKNLSKFVQRKEATVLREFLPDKHEYCIFVPLTKVQEKLYRYFLDRNKMCSENRGKSMLCDYTALRKIWTHPQVLQNAYDRAIKGELKFDTVADAKKRKSKNQVDEDENEEPDDLLDHADGAMGVKNNWWSHLITLGDQQTLFSSNKLILLFNILRMCQERGEKVLVFSAFVAVLNIVEHFMREIHKTHEQLKNTGTLNAAAESMGLTEFLSMWKEGLDYYRLDGSTKRDVRHEMVKQFNNRANKRLRCFLISAKAGGQGINLTGANRCIILDTSWNPSSDQQNIFRIYRLGQPKTCFVYRLIAIGTMEETVYSRSVTKQAMSGRVVDKMQIDRHYKSNELSETHTFIPVNMDKRPAPNMPVDDILKKLLHLHPDKAFKYHDHDSLLENKPEQDLNEDEIKEAWMNYEQDMKGVPTRSIMGQQMPMVNELNANIFNPNYFIPPLDATNSLLQQIYPSAQSTLFSQMDYLNFYLDQSGFRNPAASSSTANAITPGVATPSASYLRNQLNSNIPFPTLANPYFPSITKPVSAATMPKRRQSAAKVIPAAAVAADNSNLNQLASLQKRIYRNHDNPTPQNSSANLLIVPDLEPNVVRKTMSQLPKTSSQGTKIRSNTFTPPKPIQKIQSMQQVQQRVSLGNTNGVQAQRLMVTPNNPVLPGQDLINKTANGNVQKSPNVFRPSVQKSPSQMTKSSGAARTIGNISKTLTAANPASRILKSVGAPQLKPPNKPGNPSQVVRMPTALTVQQRPPVKMLQGNLGLAQRGLSQNKIVMNPQHRLTPEIVPANSKSNPPSTSVSKPVQLSGLASSPISITKLPSGTQKIAPKMPPLATGSISLHQIPKDGISQASPSFSRHFSNIQQKGNLQLSVPQRSSAPGNILKAISSSQPQSISQPMGSSQRINSQAIITPKSSSQVSGIFPRISNVPQKRPAEKQSPQNPKKPRFNLPPGIKVTPHGQRERVVPLIPSEVIDIDEIE